VERLRRGVKKIDVITPTLSQWGQTAVFGENTSSCVVKGLHPDYNKIEMQHMVYGRFINDVDILESRKVCTIGNRVYEELFTKGEDPCGNYIRVNGVYYQVIGVNNAEGNMSINGQASEAVSIPFTTMQRTYPWREIDMLCITARPGVKVTELQDEIEAVLKPVHYIHPDDKEAVMFFNAEAMFSMVDNLFKGINILIVMVGLGTLLAGAIGVSNIMMVTVKERTTEIGIRRAIGARPRDILQQILSESMVLTTLAGMAGITFGVFVLEVMESATHSPESSPHFQVSFWMAIGTCALLVTLGMLAGLAPAYRAMSIKPIEAIRDE